jgi:hypothetical protein
MNRYATDPFDIIFDNRRLFKDAVAAGFLDDKLRTLELRLENTFAMTYGDDKSDTVSATLRYTQGGAVTYMKHVLFIGLKADAGASFPSIINDETGSFQYLYYMQNLTRKGRVMRANVAAPVIADIRIFGPVRAMLSISPQINYTHTAPSKNEAHYLHFNSQHVLDIDIPKPELSIRGTVGDKLDFAVKPTVSNSVFFSGLEVRYRF